MADLLGCPFCGGDAESDSQRHYRNISTGNLEKSAAIYCTSCSADMTWCYRDTPEIEREQVMLLLTEQWNTRATLSQPTADRREIVARPTAFLAWAVDMFGSVAKLRSERLMRFVEEAIELAQAESMDRGTLILITDRVYSRPPGDVPKEIGQAQACLEMFAENIGLSSADEAEREFQRVQNITRDEWQCRHSAKVATGIATLDGGRDA